MSRARAFRLPSSLVLLVLALASCRGPVRPYASLGPLASPLREQFNADAGKTRILLLTAPTCPACLRGASEVQRHVLARLDDPSVRAYVVWVPMSRGMERDVPTATKEVSDPRAQHYWDGDGQLIRAYRDVLGGFDEPVWDTYLLYGPEAKWEGERPPAPAYWMHQLGSARRPRVKTGPFWSPAVFLEKAKALGVR